MRSILSSDDEDVSSEDDNNDSSPSDSVSHSSDKNVVRKSVPLKKTRRVMSESKNIILENESDSSESKEIVKNRLKINTLDNSDDKNSVEAGDVSLDLLQTMNNSDTFNDKSANFGNGSNDINLGLSKTMDVKKAAGK